MEISSHASTMALLSALALALLLMVTTLSALPAVAALTGGGSTASDSDGNTRPTMSSETSSLRQNTPQPAPLPKRGKASNPYDMKALQNFDAGSHR